MTLSSPVSAAVPVVLPPVHSTPVLLMRFTRKTSPQLLSLVKERLVQGGLVIVQQEEDRAGRIYLGLSAHFDELLAEAQHIRLKKRTCDDTNIMEYVRVSSWKQFCRRLQDDDHAQTPRDSHSLFSLHDWSLLVWSMLDEIDVLPSKEGGAVSSNLSRMLDGEQVVYKRQQQPALSNNDDQTSMGGGGGGNLLSSPQRGAERSDCLRHVLQAYNYCDLVTPLHLPHICHSLFQQTYQNIFPPTEALRDYYGEEIAFYFAWMEFLTRWLCFPAVLGVLVLVFRLRRGDTVDEDEYAALYGLVCFVWAVLFGIFWQRQEHRLAYRWGTFSSSDYQKQRYFTKRPEFRGTLRVSPVTGQLETHYPMYKRRLKMVASALLTSVLLAVAFVVMIMSLNVQGYIHPRTDPERWTRANPHPFHVAYLAELAEPGRVFDATSNWRCHLPVVVHVCCIFTMNLLYRTVAEWLTEWENHETHRTHRNSIILKRFLFEAFDCYVALFYLAFYERDVHRLRLELVSIFSIDTFRRLLLECIVPMLLQKYRQRNNTNNNNKSRYDIQVGLDKKQDGDNGMNNMTTMHPTSRLIQEAERDDYDQFDDYLEIVIELGYVTLFAAAFPLASLIAVVANVIEMHADCFKLAFLCRRPRSIRSDGLGMWKTLVQCLIWLSALTNCLIFGFTSDQMRSIFPEYYNYDQDSDKTRLAPQSGWIVIFVMFALERVLVYLGLLLTAMIPSVPESLMEELERRQWIREQESKQWRHQDRLKRSDDGSLRTSNSTRSDKSLLASQNNIIREENAKM